MWSHYQPVWYPRPDQGRSHLLGYQGRDANRPHHLKHKPPNSSQASLGLPQSTFPVYAVEGLHKALLRVDAYSWPSLPQPSAAGTQAEPLTRTLELNGQISYGRLSLECQSAVILHPAETAHRESHSFEDSNMKTGFRGREESLMRRKDGSLACRYHGMLRPLFSAERQGLSRALWVGSALTVSTNQ